MTQLDLPFTLTPVSTFNAYEERALATAQYPRVPGVYLPIYPALGLAGEGGEFSEKVKKAWRDETPLDLDAAMKELGDILWYITAAANDLGFTLADVAERNLRKLDSRRERGTLGGSGDDR